MIHGIRSILVQKTGEWIREYGKAKEDTKLLKKEWLPKLIMTSPDEFDAAWDHYVDMYNSTINVKAYEKQLDIEIQNRMKNRIK